MIPNVILVILMNQQVNAIIIINHSINKKSANYSVFTHIIETNSKTPKFKFNDRVRIIKYKNIFSKVDSKNGSKEIFAIDSVLKTNPWTCKIKDLNGEKIIWIFYEEELLFSIL